MILRVRHVNQCNRLDNPEIDPYKYTQLFFDKNAHKIKWRKDTSVIQKLTKIIAWPNVKHKTI